MIATEPESDARRSRPADTPVIPPDGKLLLTKQEVAGLLGCTVRHVQELLHQRKLRDMSTHSHPRIPRIDVERLAGLR